MRTTRHRAISSPYHSGAAALLLALVAAGCADDAMQARDLEKCARMARTLAEALPQDLASGPLRVIANPFIRKPGAPPDVVLYHRAVLRGLAAGLGRDLREEEIVFPDLRSGAWEQPERFLLGKSLRTPLTVLMVPDAFDRLSEMHPESRLFISIIGVPEALPRSRLWTHSKAPALALYLPDFNAIPDPLSWRRAFEQGRIVAAVVQQAGHPEGRLLRGTDAAGSLWPLGSQ